MTRPTLRAVAPALLASLAACGGTRSLALEVEAEDAIVSRAVVVEVALLRGGCGSTDVVYEARGQLAAMPRLPVPPALEAGRWALAARARDTDCVYFAEGCEEVQLPSERQALSVALVETDLREAACPAAECSEGLCAGIDVDPPMGPPVPRVLAPPPLASTGSYRAGRAMRPRFTWTRSVGATEYELEVSAPCTTPGVASCDFSTPAASARTAATTIQLETPLLAASGARFAWRVRACDAAAACSGWSTARLLDVGRDPGDLDGDGLADVVVGAEGAVGLGLLLVAGGDTPSGPLGERARRTGGGFGRAIAVGDADGDGRAEIYAGEPLADVGGALDAGRLVRIVGSMVDEVPLGSAIAGAAAGSAISLVGDVDANGYRDLAVGAPQRELAGERVGAVIVLARGPAGLAAPVTLFAPEPQHGARFGEALAGGDLDGDGYADLVVGEPRRTPTLGVEDAGAVYVFRGGPSGLGTEPSIVITSELAEELLGSALAVLGDVDGDGREDLALGAPGARDGGVVRLLPGSDAGPRAPGVTLPAPGTATGRFGASLAGPGDVNGDGLADLVAGAPSDPAAYLYLGAMGGPALAPARVLDATADVGGSLAIAGDVDGDGLDDVGLASSTEGLALHRGESIGLPAIPSRVLPPPSGASIVAVGARGR